ncbi:hypothetical protein N7516_009937, partial [Penicillium verrucosum]|uniref:uncharacterized protein n=1 Tax=Penicillium verrucosum TaxID=60171 RepID=UPI002544D565
HTPSGNRLSIYPISGYFGILAAIKATKSKGTTSKRKLIQQKQYQRKASLIRKAYEYSRIYSADIYIGIRIRETG